MNGGIQKLGYCPVIMMSSEDWSDFTMHGALCDDDGAISKESFKKGMRFQLVCCMCCARDQISFERPGAARCYAAMIKRKRYHRIPRVLTRTDFFFVHQAQYSQRLLASKMHQSNMKQVQRHHYRHNFPAFAFPCNLVMRQELLASQL